MRTVIRKFKKIFNLFKLNFEIKRKKVQCGKNFSCNGVPFFATNGGALFFGDNCKVNSGKKYNPIGGDTRCAFIAQGDGIIKIGDSVGISNSTFVAKSNITIEDDVLIGGGCCIYDTDFHSIVYEERIQNPDPGIVSKPVLIKKGAFIGAHCIILKGVIIGEKSIIGAGSVVTKSVPDGEIWGGNPAHFIRKI